MIKSKWLGAITALLMAVTVLTTGFAYLNPAVFTSITEVAEPAYALAMNKEEVLSIQIIADDAEWANMLENATQEEYIPATIIINGMRIENVGIRAKGNSSLSTVARNSETDRFSFKLEFDHYINGQTWLGLDKLAINNMMSDASYMKEYLSYDIMDYVGVEAPIYAFADISLNGEAWGFYLAVECLEDSYAQRVYGNDHGKLYKPEGMGGRGGGRMNEIVYEIQENEANMPQAEPKENEASMPQAEPQERVPVQRLDVNVQDSPNIQNRERFGIMGDRISSGGISLEYSDDEISSYSAIFDNSVFDTTKVDYKRMIASLKKLSNGEDLENTVDIEAVLKYFAAHTAVVNLDSYVSGMAHNYYLYEANGQLTILPWDYNMAFGGFQSGDASDVVNFPIDTPVSGVSLNDRPIIGKLLEVPEYLEMYHEYLRQIIDGYFNSGLFEQTINSLNGLISPYVENDPTAFFDYDAYKVAIVELKQLGLLRAESIEGQLDGVIPSTGEGQSADKSRLVDASNVNLSALGSMGGDARIVIKGFGGNIAGYNLNIDVDWENMQKVSEIIQSAGENSLTDEQLAELKELGFTNEQITQLQSMGQDGFGGIGNRPQGGMRGGFPNAAQGDRENAANQNPMLENGQSAIVAEFGASTLFYIGGYLALLLSGLAFVVLFRRRRNA